MNKGNFARVYLKPGTFFSHAFTFGYLIGYTLFTGNTSGSEQKLYIIFNIRIMESVISAAVYSVSIFVCFSLFAILTVRRTVYFLIYFSKFFSMLLFQH